MNEITIDGVRYIPIAEAAHETALSHDQIVGLCEAGKTPAKIIGNKWYLSPDGLRAFIQREREREGQSRYAHDEAGCRNRRQEEGMEAILTARDKLFLLEPKPVRRKTRTHVRYAALLILMFTWGTFAVIDPAYRASSVSAVATGTMQMIADVEEFVTRDVAADIGHLFASARDQVAVAALNEDRTKIGAAGALAWDGIARTAALLAKTWNRSVDDLVYGIAYKDVFLAAASVTQEDHGRAVVRDAATDVRSNTSLSTEGALAIGTVSQNTQASAATTTHSLPAAPQPIIPARSDDTDRSGGEHTKTIERFVSQSGVTEAELALRLNQLDNKLTSQIYSLSSQNSTAIGAAYQEIAHTNRIDTLASVEISGSSWSGGTIANAAISGAEITNSSLSATSLSVSGAANLATTTISGDLTVNGSLTMGEASASTITTTNLNATNATATNATSTNLYAENAVAGAATSTSLFATIGRFTSGVIDTLSAPLASFGTLTATNATTTSATTTDLYISGTFTGSGLTACSGASDKIIWNATTKRFGCGADAGAGGGITALKGEYSTFQTGASQTFATSSDTNIGLTIVSSADVHTFTPIWSGTLAGTRGGTGLSAVAENQLLIGGAANSWTQIATSSLGIRFADLVGSATDVQIANELTVSGGAIDATPIGASSASTAVFTHATTTNLAVSGISGSLLKTTVAGAVVAAVASTDYAPATSGTSVLLGNGSGGFSSYTGSTCTNQFVRSLNGAGIATCESVSLTADVTGILPATNGGTGQNSSAWNGIAVVDSGVWSASSSLAIYRGGTNTTSQSTNGVAYFDGSKITTNSALLYDGTKFTASYASTTAFTASGMSYLNGGLLALASSTIGNGNQNGGLTISGGATTTGNAYFGGNVGIGTTNPSYAKLQVNASSLGTNTLLSLSTNDGTYNPRVFISHVTSASSQYLNFDSGYSTGIGYANWVFSNGNVGIGTTSPQSKLHVATGFSGMTPFTTDTVLSVEGSAASAVNILGANGSRKSIFFSGNSSNIDGSIIYDESANLSRGFQFRTGGNSTKMVIDSTGNVGIGTTGPGASIKLSVNGTLGIGADEIPIAETSFGYSSAYKVLRLGLDINNRALALSVDPTTVAGGSFGGNGQILIGNKGILAPDAAGTNWMGVLRATGGKVYLGGTTSSGELVGDGLVVSGTNVGIGTTAPGSATKLNVAGRGVFTGGVGDPGDSSGKGTAIGYNTASDYGFVQSIETGVAGHPLILQPISGNVGIASTSPNFKFVVNGSVAFQGITTIGAESLVPLCWKSSTSEVKRSTVVNTCDATDGDVAERFGTEEQVMRGEIVGLGTTVATREFPVMNLDSGEATTTYAITTAKVRKATASQRDRIIGAVPTSPFIIGSDVISPADNPQTVALVGHVPIKMTLDGGDIRIGDPITVSVTTPGWGMKATTSGRIIGWALEDFSVGERSADGMIEVYVRPQEWFAPGDYGAILELSAFASTTDPVRPDSYLGLFLKNLFVQFAHWFADTANGIGDFFAGRIHTKEICVQRSNGTEFCADGDRLAAMAAAGSGDSTPTPSTSSPSASADTTPPDISINGANPATITAGDTYNDLGAIVIGPDDADKNLAITLKLDGVEMPSINLDTTTAGTHSIQYSATDAAGNTGTAERTVIVSDGAHTAGGSGTANTAPTDTSTVTELAVPVTDAATSTTP